MPEASLTAAAERASVVAAVDAFVASWRDTGDLLGAEHRDVTDRTATDRWVLRFRGAEKDVIAIWLTLGQRTVLAEAEVLPAPDEAVERIHELVLTRNAGLFGLSYAIGKEHGIYLIARVPAASIDCDELDRVCGAIVSEVDEVYPTVMRMAFPRQYRRRRTG